jgi:hypothetical protein
MAFGRELNFFGTGFAVKRMAMLAICTLVGNVIISCVLCQKLSLYHGLDPCTHLIHLLIKKKNTYMICYNSYIFI